LATFFRFSAQTNTCYQSKSRCELLQCFAYSFVWWALRAFFVIQLFRTNNTLENAATFLAHFLVTFCKSLDAITLICRRKLLFHFAKWFAWWRTSCDDIQYFRANNTKALCIAEDFL